MILRPELHDDDPLNRERLLQQLRQVRREMGLGPGLFADGLGVTKTMFNHIETHTAWQVRRVQAWARLLDHRLRMTITGLVVPGDNDPTAAILAATTTFGAFDEDQQHLFTVVNDLTRIRRHLGWGYQRMGQQMGVTDNAARAWERDHAATLVKMVQRYARGLGGALLLELEPVPALVAAS
jgi:DNA-binding XRE family transcriptional regulator